MEDDLGLTEIQMKAIKAAERALKQCHTLGVGFWENYGHLEVYNTLKIEQPVPDHTIPNMLENFPGITYLIKGITTTANADDTLYFNKID